MEEKAAVSRQKPSLALSAIVFLIVAALISWAVIKVQAEVHMPIVTAAIFVALVGMFVQKIPWADLEENAISSIMAAMQANMILMSVGILVGVWLISGVVPGLIYYGLFILKPAIFPLATLLICSIISLATGSSWQTSGTIGIAMLGIGNGLGVPAALTAGVIISGAYFGDKMSPLSDTTNLAPAVSGASLFDHIKAMCWTTGPTYVIVAVILAFMGMKFAGGAMDASRIQAIQQILFAEFKISPLCFLPPLVIIVMAVMKMPALPGIFAGILVSAFMAIFQGVSIGDLWNIAQNGYSAALSQNIADAADVAAVGELLAKNGLAGIAPELAKDVSTMIAKLVSRGGMQSMLWSVSMVICALTLGGFLERCGYLEVLLGTLTRNVKRAGGLIGTVVLSSIVSNVFLGDQYLSIVIPGRMFKTTFEKSGLAPRMLSRTLEDAGTLTSALVPWNTCGAYQTSVLGVPTLTYAPYAMLNYLNPIMSVVLTYLGIGIYWRKDGEDKVEKRTLLAEGYNN